MATWTRSSCLSPFVEPHTPRTSLLHQRAAKHRWIVVASGEKKGMDATDVSQQVDIERLINNLEELQDKVSVLEGAVADGERRDKDRMVALRGIVRAALARVGSSSPGADADDLMSHLERVEETDRKKESKWDSYRNSFTLLMSKSYLQTMDQLRDKLMAAEWEVGLRPMALQMGVARFEAYCGQNNIPITFDRITQLYDDPEDLSVIEDAHLRMQARAIIVSVETEQQLACWQMCTTEAQKLAQQFSEGEFISKLLPDPIEHGIIDSLRKMVWPK